MQTQKRTKRHNWESGQSLVEMALGFMLFLVVVLGLLDLGRLFFIYIAMEDSASEAALYLALNPACPQVCSAQTTPSTACVNDASVCNDPNNALDRAENSSNIIRDAIDWENTKIEHQFIPADDITGTEAMVSVAIEYPFALITPIITDIVGSDTFVLRAEATHVQIVDDSG